MQVSQEGGRGKQTSSFGRVTKRPGMERWGSREEKQAGPGEVGSHVGWGRGKGKVKRTARPVRVLENGHDIRPGSQAFLDAQDQSYLRSGFKMGSETAQVPRVDRGSWH